MERAYRVRRSCLSVPASSDRFITSARGAGVDEVFLDLEDSVAAGAKAQARAAAVSALTSGEWAASTVGVRINDVSTPWAVEDVLAVVCPRLDEIVLPKVRSVRDVIWLDVLLGQVEALRGLPHGAVGIEAQIEDAAGLACVEAIASCSSRLEALVFGPADFMASVGMRSLEVGEQPSGYAGGDAYHYPLMRILVAARSAGLQAVDGPYLRVRDTDGFRRSAGSAAALGYDGKWVLHPSQVQVANEVFAPTPAEVARASAILAAYAQATDVELRGAVMLGDEMIDEASRKMALAVVARAQAAGLA
ncbi:MAG TPA: CoA ester lyase [Streptosporangiaceae bacterium]|nr:CoA ester lyase [Streptosporangiaceae bacterium]